MTAMPTIHDLDADAVAELLRNLAHAIEEDKTALIGIESETAMSTEDDRPVDCSLTLHYIPSTTVLIPGKRLSEGMEVHDE